MITLENINYEIATSNSPELEEITMKELETAIKIMKKGKERIIKTESRT